MRSAVSLSGSDLSPRRASFHLRGGRRAVGCPLLGPPRLALWGCPRWAGGVRASDVSARSSVAYRDSSSRGAACSASRCRAAPGRAALPPRRGLCGAASQHARGPTRGCSWRPPGRGVRALRGRQPPGRWLTRGRLPADTAGYTGRPQLSRYPLASPRALWFRRASRRCARDASRCRLRPERLVTKRSRHEAWSPCERRRRRSSVGREASFRFFSQAVIRRALYGVTLWRSGGAAGAVSGSVARVGVHRRCEELRAGVARTGWLTRRCS